MRMCVFVQSRPQLGGRHSHMGVMSKQMVTSAQCRQLLESF